MIKNFNKFRKDLANSNKCKRCIKYIGINYCIRIQGEK